MQISLSLGLGRQPPEYKLRFGTQKVLENEHSAQAEATDLPVHLKSAKELSDPRDSEAADFLAGLLAPARSGVIVTRADLGRMAKELDHAASRRGE